MGQSSLPILSKSGIYMYWSNCWLNNFNQKNFLNKSIFLENLFLFIFSEKLFNFFFKKKLSKNFKINFFKISLNKFKYKNKTQVKTKLKKKNNYNFTRVWFIKYNNTICVSTFVFHYFKVKTVKKKNLNRIIFIPTKHTLIFWKKKKNNNLKKKFFLSNINLVF